MLFWSKSSICFLNSWNYFQHKSGSWSKWDISEFSIILKWIKHKNFLSSKTSIDWKLMCFHDLKHSFLLSRMEASSDQVQLKSGEQFWAGGQTWDTSRPEVRGWWTGKLANQAVQTSTLCVKGQRQHPHLKGGASLCRVHWNIQVLLCCSASWPDLFSACVRERWAQINADKLRKVQDYCPPWLYLFLITCLIPLRRWMI